jgi:hypothetical protein
MNFDGEKSNQLKNILSNEKQDCKIFVIDAYEQDFTKTFFDSDYKDEWFDDMDCNWFDALELDNNPYIEEKSKGGKNSYKAYKPLKDKVKELCKAEIANKHYSSANQLCNKVARMIEAEHAELLEQFPPYKSSELNGGDWKKPTFYDWCNQEFKTHQASKETEIA